MRVASRWFTSLLLLAAAGCSHHAQSEAFSLGSLKAGMTLAQAQASSSVAGCHAVAEMTSTDPHDYYRLRATGKLWRTDPTRQICGLADQTFADTNVTGGSVHFGPAGLTGIIIDVAEQDYDHAKAAVESQYGHACRHETFNQHNMVNGTVRDIDPYAVGGYSDRPTSQEVNRLTDSDTWCFADGELTGRRFSSTLGSSTFEFSRTEAQGE